MRELEEHLPEEFLRTDYSILFPRLPRVCRALCQISNELRDI